MNIDEKSINELRILANEMITNAKSGHPGIALGAAPIVYSLYANVMAVDSDDEKNYNRDRFVLSAGHGSSILYATLHAMGYDISKEDLMKFRKLGSKTPGHPEVFVTPGIDASTGPLGQGVANAVGMAIAEKHLEALFNKPDAKLFDSKIFCLVGDGCLMEGVSYEALSLAGNLKLDNFVLIYDHNNITIEGKTEITFCDDIKKRFETIGFEVLHVNDGNNANEITDALNKAKQAKKPVIVDVLTTIGYGTELAGNQKIHGSPLDESMLEKLRKTLQVEKQYFELSQDVKDNFKMKSQEAKKRLKERDKIKEYSEKYPEDYARFEKMFFNNNFDEQIEKIKDLKADEDTTRGLNHVALNKLAEILPNIFGGSADVATSTRAYVDSAKDFSSKNYAGDLIRYGVREHAMAGISNGIALFGGFLPYQSCFFTFYDYLKPALRMTALMNLRVLSVFSHDSITAGQDGPTHQPIEQLPALRLTPNTIVSRPYNFAEVLASYVWFLKNNKPVCILVSKDKMNFLESDVNLAIKGGYVLKEDQGANITIVSTGGDVDRCLKACEILKNQGIRARIVSMSCVSVFEEQTDNYKNMVLGELPKVFVEASADNCWLKFAERADLILNLHNFGRSGSPDEILSYLELDGDGIAERILNWHKNI